MSLFGVTTEMVERNNERLELAETVRRTLAIENELSRPQARAYVRCLQVTWDVPTINWSENESLRQLEDARRLLHAAHIFSSIEGPSSIRANDCYRRRGKSSNGSHERKTTRAKYFRLN